MQIVTISLHDLQLMLDRTAEKVIEALTNKTEPTTEKDRWFDLNELCNYHPEKPAKATVYGWVNAYTVPFYKKGKKLYFLKSEIDDWLKAGRKKTLAEAASEADNYLRTKKGLNYGK